MNITAVSFPTQFDVSWLEGMRWRVLTEFSVDAACHLVGADGFACRSTIRLIAPVGFVTDLASVPRVFWSLFPPEGKYTKAAAIHDYLYSVGGRVSDELSFSRAGVDRVFYLGMKALGVSEFSARSMWLAVRTFGGSHWGTEKHGN
jgi:uncharacterized protein DUF1353